MTDSSLDRGQSSPIGVILIIGLTLTAAVGIVMVGGDAIEGTQSQSELGQAEQAMTQFDARAAQVALGDSDSTTVSLGGQGGQYKVEEDVGRVKIIHENWNNSNDTQHQYEIYNETLGAIVYTSGETTIAYQGGGVWRKGPDGDSRLVSSPEFHYRDATLTFPLVRVEGSGGGSGDVRANVQRVETAKDIYPNHSETYPDGETKLLNPTQHGNVTVEITSDYCEGWRQYFKERTEGDVSECNDGTVTADIVALGTQGEFPVTDGSELNIRGMETDHSMNNFEIEFRTREEDASEFNNIRWRLYGEDDEGRQLEYFISTKGIGNKCSKYPAPAKVVIYYSPNGGDDYHSWVNTGSHGTGDYLVECKDGDVVLTVDFLDPDIKFEYQDYKDLSGNKNLHFDDDAESFNSTVSFGEHPGQNFEDGAITYDSSTDDEENVTLLTNHYEAMQGDVDMQIDEDNAAGLGDASSGNIEYEGSGNVVTYLHVTENRIKVELS